MALTTTALFVLHRLYQSSRRVVSSNAKYIDNENIKWEYVIGFGSLLSEKSAKSTMPNLKNFQLTKLHGFRRLFTHPANIFVERGIANMKTGEVSSLCVEPLTDNDSDNDKNINPFIVSLFEMPHSELDRLFKREEEFHMIQTEIYNPQLECNVKGWLCCKGTDEMCFEKWSQEKFDKEWKIYGIDTIWNWVEKHGPIYPCRVYLRHCLLACKKQGQHVLDDFMKNTYLYDRKTTIKEYMEKNPDIWHEKPPKHLESRYNG